MYAPTFVVASLALKKLNPAPSGVLISAFADRRYNLS